MLLKTNQLLNACRTACAQIGIWLWDIQLLKESPDIFLS